MNRVKLHAWLHSLLWCTLLIIALLCSTVAASTKSQVLIIHSSYQGYPWTDAIQKSIEQELSDTNRPIELWVEYIDTKRNTHSDYFHTFQQFITSKYSHVPLDLIMVVDNAAYDFVMGAQQTLFDKTPLVFTGFNGFKEEIVANNPLITGVTEDNDFKSTIDIALKLHPSTKKVVFLVPDAWPSRLDWIKELPELYKDKPIEFINIKANTLSTIDQALAELGSDIIVLPLNSFQLSPGRYLQFELFIEHLASNGNYPVYGLWDIAIGHGIVGGKLVSSQLQGKFAALLAKQVLRGTPPIHIPIMTDSPNQFMFDWRQLQRFNVNISDLPANAIVINQPKSFYQQYKQLVWWVSSIIVLLFIMVVALTINISHRKKAERTLAISEKKYKTLFESTSDAVILSENLLFVDGNQAAFELLGCGTLEEFQQKSLIDALPINQPDGSLSIDEFKQAITESIENGFYHFEFNFQHIIMHKNITADVQLMPISIELKTYIQISIRDITIRKTQENNLRIAAIAFESQDGIMVSDINDKILRVNAAFSKITGYNVDDIIGKKPHFLNSKRHNKEFFRVIRNSLTNQGSWEGELWQRRKNNTLYLARLTITSVKDLHGKTTHYVSIQKDITEASRSAQTIEQLAFYDPLTTLPNRRMLFERLSQALSKSHRTNCYTALLFLDIDDFKIINDTLGHNIGDTLLQEVAKRLSQCISNHDTLARNGGDEFVIVLDNLSTQHLEAAQQAELKAKEITSALNHNYKLAQRAYSIHASIGISLTNGRGLDIAEFMQQADIAMYQAKTSGKNSFCFFDPKMQANIIERATLERDLANALDKQQFVLYYQVQIDENLQPLGAEALIRWQHPKRGLVPPLKFISLAEETKHIINIGHWIFESACQQLKIWQDQPENCHLTLSVNVSVVQFSHPDFVKQLLIIINNYNIDPKLLKLELTESLLLDNVDNTVAIMNQLADIGITFSLDDFGTGYSSLQYLKKLPLCQLKIDQSFVRDLVNDPSDQAIVQTIISMAHGLGLSVIAEGVETQEQCQYLASHHCTHFQGYLFSKPLPVNEFNQLLIKMHSKP